MRRRAFLRLVAGAPLAAACRRDAGGGADASASLYDGKVDDLVLHTERPPNLEMPARYFAQDLTPNEAMFVRWHVSQLPTRIDDDSFRLRVGGHVDHPLELSLDQLRARFEEVSVVAVNQCSGNGRSAFGPRVPGVQWGRGAVGNARWTGARLKHLLAAASPRAGAVEVTFRGLDKAPLESVPEFVKSLSLDKAGEPDVLVAWAMNDAPLPMLNGYPVRLVVPGWYSTYWVKALESITVVDHPFDGYWMKKAYRIPANEDANESPDALSKDTVPIAKMNVRSLVVRPEPGEEIRSGAPYEVQGLAWDGGSGIARVEVSFDGGASWSEAKLDPELGKYAWRRWRASWTPVAKGSAIMTARATSAAGESQRATPRWNRSGYMKNDPERVEVRVP